MGTYLNRTPSSAGNEKTWTVSLWVKRASITSSASQFLFASDTNYSDYVWCRFCGTEVTGKADMLQVFMTEPNAREGNVRTNRLFRDPASWYHIVVRCDLTQSTAADRLRIYVNGVQETSFDTATYLNQNDDNINWNSNVPQVIGAQLSSGTSERFQNGYITNFVNIDGQSLAPTSFGETDSTTGEWKPKADLSGLTFGTNGFWQKYESAGNLGLDSSGNSNTYTVNNAGTGAQAVDTASNNFATINPVAQSRFSNQGTISLGNLKYDGAANDRGWGFCSMGVTKGKWYWEIKATATDRLMIGVGYQSVLDFSGTFFGNNPSKAFSILSFNGNLYYDGTNTSYGPTFVANDIIMVALDMDNYLCWFGKNGTWSNNATQTEIENATATNDATTKMGTKQNINNGDFVFPFITAQENAQTGAGIFNFGNPPFTISSGNADANGHGNFEYAVPSGYYSLCTKNINSYG